MPSLVTLLLMLRALVLDRQRLLLENAALRQQVIVLKRSVKRPQIRDSDRIFWILMRRALRDWKSCLLLVQPDTVVRWHRKGWRYYWRRQSRPHVVGRPAIGWKLVHLIRRLSTENPLWGAPRIQAELAVLRYKVAESSVDKYMVRPPRGDGGQRWATFLRNHLRVTAACDLFTVPTATFRNLFVLVVLSHERRLIRRVAVTANPTSAWIAGQLREAFPGGDEPKYLLHDRDGAFTGEEFARQLKAMCIRELLTTAQSPWENCYVERVIGTIRRECTDHVIPFGERHLHAVLTEFVAYYNVARSHQSLEGNSPLPRDVEPEPAAEVRATPVLGGLHHIYERAA
jgi:transposase InsO family protein